jgi:hypothetical protein
MSSDWYRVARLCDMHVPFEDEVSVNAAFDFVTNIQPDEIIIDEWHDFYSVSRFSKDPSRIDSLQDELDGVYAYMSDLRKRCPKATITMLESNHTDRLQKYLWANAQALSRLRCLELPTLMKLDDFGISYAPMKVFRDIYIEKHGDIVRKHSAYTAHGEQDREGMSGASGHTHRLGKYYVTVRGGRYQWMECGCLCDLSPSYYKGVPNWQPGMGLTQFKDDGTHFSASELPVVDGEILWS